MNKSTNESVHSQVKKGFAWSLLENISLQGIRFFIGIVMARILAPSDYGMVGMLTVFIVISDLLINSGIGSALIKKQDRTETDFHTAFVFNVSVGIALYLILFFSAPLIAAFYNVPQLNSLTKVLSLSLIINSLAIIPSTKLQIAMDFKRSSIISIATAVVNGICGIYLAVTGFGVWALVYSTVISNMFRCLFLYVMVRWLPRVYFSCQSFREMFAYGSKLLVALLMDAVYTNIYPLVIGRVYAASALGFYTRAQGYANLPSATLTMMIYRVCFPAFCKEANDREKLLQSYRKIMRNVAFAIFLLMGLLMALARPLVVVLISEKWLPCVNMLKVLCLAVVWYPVLEVNLSVVKALGQSSAVLRMQVFNKIFAIAVLLVTLHFDIIIICWGAVLISLFSLWINFRLSQKILNISVWRQFACLVAPVTGSIIMYLVVTGMLLLVSNSMLQCLSGGIIGLATYLLVTARLGYPVMPLLRRLPKLIQK